MPNKSGFPYAEVQFTRDGEAHDATEVAGLSTMASAENVTDLLVVSHGWNNNIAEARELYDNLLRHLRAHLDANSVPGAGGRRYGVAAVLWPSKKFAEKELIPSGAAGFGDLLDASALAEQVDDLKAAIGDAQAEARLEEIKPLLTQVEDDPDARRAVVDVVRGVLPRRSEDLEDASDEFFSEDPVELMDRLAEVVLPPPVLPSGDSGGAADFSGGGG
ncbi:MAG: hypothetical protein ACRDZO_00085, partial [Egibacteraceae bacterium]